MANRLGMVNIGAVMSGGLRELLQEREEQRRYDLASEREAEQFKEQQAERMARLKIIETQEKRAEAEEARKGDSSKLDLEMKRDMLRHQQKVETMTDVEGAGPGGTLTAEVGARAKQLIPWMVDVKTPGQLESRSLAVSANPMDATAPIIPSVASPGIAEVVQSKGTIQQQALARLKTSEKLSPEIKDMIEAGILDDTALARLLQPNDTDVSWQRFTGRRAGGTADEILFVNPKTREIQDSTRTPVTEKVTPVESGGQGAAPFFMPIGSSFGTTAFSGRTGQHQNEQGQWVDGPIPLRPTGGQQQQMTANAGALTQINLLKESFNPEWLGPATGRVGTMYTKFINDKDNAGLARFQTRTSALKNGFIKAITGAQMSEPEALRIMQQLPDMNLPPVTFWERITVAEQDLNNLLEIQQQVYTGTRRPAESPVTEAQLQKLFPDSKLIGGPPASTGSKPVSSMPSGVKEDVYARARRLTAEAIARGKP